MCGFSLQFVNACPILSPSFSQRAQQSEDQENQMAQSEQPPAFPVMMYAFP